MMGKNAGRGIVALMIILSVIALLLRFSLEYVLNFNIKQQEQNALDTLKLVSTAVENYAKDHLGVFPDSLSELVKTDPPYIEREYYKKINILAFELKTMILIAKIEFRSSYHQFVFSIQGCSVK